MRGKGVKGPRLAQPALLLPVPRRACLNSGAAACVEYAPQSNNMLHAQPFNTHPWCTRASLAQFTCASQSSKSAGLTEGTCMAQEML